MVLGQISTALVVLASRPAVILPTRQGGTTTLDVIHEAVNIKTGDRTDATDTTAAVEHGVQRNALGDDFWYDFKERIEWGGDITTITSNRQRSMIK